MNFLDLIKKQLSFNKLKLRWRWLVLYPCFGVAVIAAIPTVHELVESSIMNVSVGQSEIAKKRNEMWRKNMTCAAAPLDPLVTETNLQVDATICKSGDVLIRVFGPEEQQFFEWVAVDKMFTPEQSVASFSLFSSAIAKENLEHSAQQSGARVLCQRWLDNVLLLRRVEYYGRGCFDETVNTYTGYLVGSVSAPCRCW